MTERKVRGLEDREAQERKNLLRDVRSPAHKLADALKNGTVQTCGVFGAGVCLFAFPVVACLLYTSCPSGRGKDRQGVALATRQKIAGLWRTDQ